MLRFWRNFELTGVIPKMKKRVRKIKIKQLGIAKVVIVSHQKPEPRYTMCEHKKTHTIGEPVDGDSYALLVLFRSVCDDCGNNVERTHPNYDLHFHVDIEKIETS